MQSNAAPNQRAAEQIDVAQHAVLTGLGDDEDGHGASTDSTVSRTVRLKRA